MPSGAPLDPLPTPSGASLDPLWTPSECGEGESAACEGVVVTCLRSSSGDGSKGGGCPHAAQVVLHRSSLDSNACKRMCQTCDVSRAQGESSGRKWGTGHRVRKGEGSLKC
eukprot:1191919-Prorocentrum_minimum.AAC.4